MLAVMCMPQNGVEQRKANQQHLPRDKLGDVHRLLQSTGMSNRLWMCERLQCTQSGVSSSWSLTASTMYSTAEVRYKQKRTK